MIKINQLFTIKEASEWATKYLGKTVTPSNISYLIQYGRIKKIDYYIDCYGAINIAMKNEILKCDDADLK